MKIHLFLIILSINMIRGAKRKLDHVYMNNFDYFEVTKVFKSCNNQLYCKTCDNKISPTTAEFDFHHTKLRNNDGKKDYFKDNYDYLNKIKSYRPVSENNLPKIITEKSDSSRSKILENFKRSITSNQKEINMSEKSTLIKKKSSEISSTTNQTEIDCKKFANCLKKVIKSSKIKTKINESNNTTSTIKHGKKPYITNSNKFKDDNVIRKHNCFKSYIEKYISNNISHTYNCNQIRKTHLIEEACSILKQYNFNKNSNEFKFDTQEDKALLSELFKLVSILGNNPEFNPETYKIFYNEFDSKIYDRFYLNELNWKFDLLSDLQKKLLFYVEFSKLYQYIEDVPELLTLGGLFLDKSCRKIIFIMHIINLFAENNFTLKDSKTFVLCLISKAFNLFNGYIFDIFLIPEYEIKCSKSRHNLYFFLWELNNNKRQNIKRRKGYRSKHRYKDRNYLMIVFLLYLYQHNIFLEYYAIDAENVKNFSIFVSKVKQSQDCIGCLFDKYLSIAIKMNKMIFN